jgi:hypothetical protein
MNAEVQPAAKRRELTTAAAGRRDSLTLGVLLIALLGVTAISLGVGPIWQPGAPSHAPWCPTGQRPTFLFGFADLAQQLGGLMGEPTECEHGDAWTSDTRQKTTTGLAVYRWCTNNPTFTREHAHWMLTQTGLVYWTDEGRPPPPQPVLRMPDIRQPCSP